MYIFPKPILTTNLLSGTFTLFFREYVFPRDHIKDVCEAAQRCKAIYSEQQDGMYSRYSFFVKSQHS